MKLVVLGYLEGQLDDLLDDCLCYLTDYQWYNLLVFDVL